MKNNNVSKQEDARRQYTINITKNAIYKLKQNVSWISNLNVAIKRLKLSPNLRRTA